MSKPAAWSLGGEPPEPQSMETPSPEEAAAIRDEVNKVRQAERDKYEAAIKRGKAKAAKSSGTSAS